MSGFVALVGAGPGDPGLLTVKAARLIAEADVLVYDALVSAPIVALAGPDCELVYVGKRARNHTMPQADIQTLLVREALAGKHVVRLKGGDPLVFGRGGEEAEELAAAGVPFMLVPGISSALAAPAYAGIPVTHRDFNTSFTVATGHEDPAKTESTLDWRRLGDGKGMAIFLMAMGNLDFVVAQLLANGRPPTTPAAIISDGTTPRQRTVTGTLASIVADAASSGIGAPAIFAVGDGVALRERIRWFDNGPLFGRRILITRPRESGDVLSQQLWEAGAEPVLVPAIAYAEPTDPAPANAAIARIADSRPGEEPFGWIVFSSAHGVRTCFARLGTRGLDARALGAVAVAAVGEKTADALRACGIRADLVPADQNAAGLARELGERVHLGDAPVLIWGAQGGRDSVETALRERGFPVERVDAYRSVPTGDPRLATEAAACDVWTFASPSAVDGFIAVYPEAVAHSQGKTIVCIGETTAEAAKVRGLDVASIAVLPAGDALIEALR